MTKPLLTALGLYLLYPEPVCGAVLLLVVHWGYLSEIAGEEAESRICEWTLRRLRDDRHTEVDCRIVLMALERNS